MSNPNMPHDHDVRKDIRKYIGVFVALLVLTVATVAVSRFHIGKPGDNTGNILVALLIAFVKAGLVAAFFMHLSSERWTIYRFLILTAFFVLGLFLLTGLAFHNRIAM